METPREPNPSDALIPGSPQLASESLKSQRSVVPMVRPFDPLDADAEGQYDAVVRRLNRVRARKTRLAKDLKRLENQFIEDDLTALSGPRAGLPLTKSGRKRRLARLVEFGIELHQAEAEERFAAAALDRMNQALDRWARETYGG